MIRIAIPSKGRLREPTLRLLEAAGIKVATTPSSERILMSPTNYSHIQVIYIRTEDIPNVVSEGAADLGITGHDYVIESEADVVELLDLRFGRARIVFAVHDSMGFSSPREIPNGMRVATKYVNIARAYFKRIGRRVRIVRVSGATEVMPLIGVAEGVVDVTSTGTTMRTHGMKVLDTIMSTSARLIASKEALASKRELVESIMMSIKGVLNAEGKKLLMMNVPETNLKEVLKVLPAMAGPTVAKVESKEPMWEVYSVVSENELLRIIFEVKARGARDILVLSIERAIP